MSNASDGLSNVNRAWGLSPETVSPGCFASVMATGIMAIGAHLEGLGVLSAVLFGLAVVLFAFFLVLVVWRVLRYPRALRADLHDPARAFGFFTVIAATNVLATVLTGLSVISVAAVLFCIGLLLWLVFGYAVPFVAVLGSSTRPVAKAVNGTWFVWVVAAQSVAVVASSLVLELPRTDAGADFVLPLSLLAVVMWAIGLALYLACAMALAVRTLLHSLGPDDFDAPFWVTMGALAISIVAGSRILELESTPIITATQLLVGGSSVLLWAFATWLIPALVLVGLWRHLRRRIPLRYSAGLWSMVFPLGMYSVASIYLGQSDEIPVIAWIGTRWFWVGFAVWVIVFAAMVWSFIRSVRSGSRQHR